MKKTLTGALAALIVGSAGAVQAADLGVVLKEPPPPAFVDTYQPFQIRVRATAIVPDSGRATIIDAGGTNPVLGLLGHPYIGEATGLSYGRESVVPGASTTSSWSVVPEVDVTYYLSKNFAIEAICCLTRNNVDGVGVLAGARLARAWIFPPSIIFQYHFTNFGAFQPYIGVGVNFTACFPDAGRNWWPLLPAGGSFATLAGVTTTTATFYSLSVTPSWGVVGQVGFDYMFNENWGVNFDLKKILMEPNVHGNIMALAPQLPLLGPLWIPVHGRLYLDPWVASVGLTYRFGASLGLGPVLPNL